jgi:hypothetical protein
MIFFLPGRRGPADFWLFTAKLRLTSLSVIFYASSRWLEGIIMAKMRPLPADPQNQITIYKILGTNCGYP